MPHGQAEPRLMRTGAFAVLCITSKECIIPHLRNHIAFGGTLLDDFRLIRLTNGGYAIVDQDDYEFLSQWRWQRDPDGYARRSEGAGAKRRGVFIHHIVARTPKGLEPDHINRNRLDNRKENLRNVPKGVNLRNCEAHCNNKAGVLGVYFAKDRNRWRADTHCQGKTIHLGSYYTKEEAAEAYQSFVKRLFDEAAKA